MPGIEWFVSRNKNFAEKIAQNIEGCRANVTKEVVKSYIETLEQTLDGVQYDKLWRDQFHRWPWKE